MEFRPRITKKWNFSRSTGTKREPCLTFDELAAQLGLSGNVVRRIISERGIKPVFPRQPFLYHASDFRKELADNPDLKRAVSPRRKELEAELASMEPGASILVTDRDQNIIANIVRDSKYTVKTKRDGEARRLWLIAKPEVLGIELEIEDAQN